MINHWRLPEGLFDPQVSRLGPHPPKPAPSRLPRGNPGRPVHHDSNCGIDRQTTQIGLAAKLAQLAQPDDPGPIKTSVSWFIMTHDMAMEQRYVSELETSFRSPSKRCCICHIRHETGRDTQQRLALIQGRPCPGPTSKKGMGKGRDGDVKPAVKTFRQKSQVFLLRARSPAICWPSLFSPVAITSGTPSALRNLQRKKNVTCLAGQLLDKQKETPETRTILSCSGVPNLCHIGSDKCGPTPDQKPFQ